MFILFIAVSSTPRMLPDTQWVLENYEVDELMNEGRRNIISVWSCLYAICFLISHFTMQLILTAVSKLGDFGYFLL